MSETTITTCAAFHRSKAQPCTPADGRGLAEQIELNSPPLNVAGELGGFELTGFQLGDL